MKRLIIAPDGNSLLAASREDQLSVWDLSFGRRRFMIDGELVGIDRDGKEVLVQREEGVKGCRLETGAEVQLAAMDADGFEITQRCVVRGQPFRLRLEVRDVFDILPLRIIQIEYDSRYFPSLDSWELGPDNTSLVATISGEVSGEDWAAGVCMNIETGQRRFKFNVNRFQRTPPICFSREHKLLLIGDNASHLSVFDLATGKTVREVYVGGFGMIASISPMNPWLAAVNAWEPIVGAGHSPFSVHLLDLLKVEGERMLRARVQAVLHVPQTVDELEFAPDGRSLAILMVDGSIHVWDLVADSVKELVVP